MMSDIWVIPYTVIAVIMGYDLGYSLGELILSHRELKKNKPLFKVEEPKDEDDEFHRGIDFWDKEIYNTSVEYWKEHRKILEEEMKEIKKIKSYLDGKEE